VLAPSELKSRYHVRLEKYIKEVDIEAVTLGNMVQNQIIPASLSFQKTVAKSISTVIGVLGDGKDLKPQKDLLKTLTGLIGDTQKLTNDLKAKVDKAGDIHDEEKKADYICKEIRKTMDDLREKVDTLEGYVDNECWPIPKYWEMLFIS